ncbi:Adenylylsulfate kinase [Micromonospora halophytica]|uniref:Adenylylsulfate kinase n=2 Tax=Micromonospora halophytica TaxID=47864 RepID=A0A1C5ILF7_9ACTN|nr:Adenylylsulfate kinase [Micromonospora halophytica]
MVTGVPGAGKSTIAGALARSEARGVHIEGDALQRMIVSGSRPPQPEYDEECEQQILLNVRNQCLLARSFLDAGHLVVLDYVVTSRHRLRYYLELLHPAPMGFVMLRPDLSVAARRDEQRPHKTVLPRWRHLAGEMAGELSGVGLWLDNGDLSVDETVRQVRSGVTAATLTVDLLDAFSARRAPGQRTGSQAQFPALS